MDNLEIYNKYKAVPDIALKSFNNGRFSGTDINTMWRIKSLTELFGAVGKGWYFEIVRLWTEQGANDNVIANAEIKLYVKYDNEWSMPISGVGGNTLVKNTKNNGLQTSDECYKMAITDALGVACKYLGFGADVYWSNDRTKYSTVEEQKKVELITTAQKEKLLELGCELEKVAVAYGKSNIEELTFEEALDAISRKQGSVAKKSFGENL